MRIWFLIVLVACAGQILAQDQQTEKERVQRVLRETVQEREATRRAALTNGTFRTDPKFAEMEARYVEGKITAKQFRKYLQEYQPPLQPAPLVTNTPALNQALEILRKHDPSAPNAAPVPPVQPAPAVAEEADPNAPTPTGDFDDFETKMEKLIQAKKAREQAKPIGVEQIELLSPASGLSQRERLDLALKLWIESVISKEEYDAHREKILAEPKGKPAPK